jgi:hypothetical protein
VHIEHESAGDNKPFSLRGQTILADLEPVPTTQPTTKPATNGASPNEKMRLKHAKVTGDVEFISLPVHFECTSVDYDPNTHILVAKGSDRVRAQLYDEKGVISGSFTQLRYNTQTGKIEETVGLRATFRK